MQRFIDSFTPLLSRYKSEVILLGSALLIALFSALTFFQQQKKDISAVVSVKKSETRTSLQKQTITIEVSGAVKKPFVYTFRSSARIIDAIQKAGGLTEDADAAFIQRNVNYARLLNDQEKLYFPSLSDTLNGYVLENKKLIDYTQPNSAMKQTEASTLININTASIIELDQLPGIGKVNAEAIFNGRPYSSPDELISKTIIKQSVYDKIESLISVY